LKMLLSINPQHVRNILNGTKRYEYRKTRCRPEVRSILIYSTAPVGRVVAEVELVKTLHGTLDEIWEQTAQYSGITRHLFQSYYEGRDKAVAYQLGEVSIFQEPRALDDFGVSCAPQSFVYMA
jgi:predicted transcriptional regulator